MTASHQKCLIFIGCLLLFFQVQAQSSYVGALGKYPIRLVVNAYGDGYASSYYVYNKYDSPIKIDGKLEANTLTLFERDQQGKVSATLLFEDFTEGQSTITGIWENSGKTKQYSLTLEKEFSIDSEESPYQPKAMVQQATTKGHYFKTIITKGTDDYRPKVSEVKVYEKKTDVLLQTISVDCQLAGIYGFSVEDFNFDGQLDFSIFEASYAGANTTSLYFLYNPDTKQYENSGFSGVSLEFDQKTKIITEPSTCCGGTIRTVAEYKVVDNKMVSVGEKCFVWNDVKQGFEERPAKDCQ